MHRTSQVTVLETVLRMNPGNGDMSYSNNSSVQKSLALHARKVLENSIKDMCKDTFPECFHIADLGCSSGENAYLSVLEIIKNVHVMCKGRNQKLPEFQVFLNDLPPNDFNTLFELLPKFTDTFQKISDNQHCFVSGTPGSFYKRLFPRESLNFVHSSNSLHWLSQVPDGLENNKGNIYIGSMSPPNVLEGYLKQFRKDFAYFLGLRSDELKPKGHMVLSLLGRASADPKVKEAIIIFELIAKSLLNMVDEGIIKEADVNSFNIPTYAPCKEEVKDIIEREGSFTLNELEVVEITDYSGDGDDIYIKANDVANTMRAILESLLTSHFGKNLIMDKLFDRFAKFLAEYLSDPAVKLKYVSLVISLTKN